VYSSREIDLWQPPLRACVATAGTPCRVSLQRLRWPAEPTASCPRDPEAHCPAVCQVGPEANGSLEQAVEGSVVGDEGQHALLALQNLAEELWELPRDKLLQLLEGILRISPRVRDAELLE